MKHDSRDIALIILFSPTQQKWFFFILILLNPVKNQKSIKTVATFSTIDPFETTPNLPIN